MKRNFIPVRQEVKQQSPVKLKKQFQPIGIRARRQIEPSKPLSIVQRVRQAMNKSEKVLNHLRQPRTSISVETTVQSLRVDQYRKKIKLTLLRLPETVEPTSARYVGPISARGERFQSQELKQLIHEAQTIDVVQKLPYDEYIDGEPKEDFMILQKTQTWKGCFSPAISSASVTLRKDLSDFGKSSNRSRQYPRFNSLPIKNGRQQGLLRKPYPRFSS